MNDSTQTTANTAQLKADIDSGRTGDKVRSSDPGASPLGTDDEAGGAPTSPAVVAKVRAAETSRNVTAPEGSKPFNATWIAVIVLALGVFFAGFAWLVR